MTLFLIVAGALAVLAAAAIALPLLRGGTQAESRDAADARVFRDQLDELDRDLARGVISQAEAEGARAEVSRRLLRAAERARRSAGGAPAPRAVTGLVAGITLLAAPLVAAGVYLSVGAPGLPDLPLADRGPAGTQAMRPSQAQAEAQVPPPGPEVASAFPEEYLSMIARLEEIVAERPRDPEGNRLLANAYMQLQRHAEAWKVIARLIEIQGSAASADLYGRQAEAMALAADGYVSPEAEAVIAEALARDPAQPMARYYAGLAMLQSGQLEGAIAAWRAMLDEAPAGAEWRDFVAEMLAEAERIRDGGAAPSPATTPGPGAADMAEAGQMSAEERAAMIEGMVGRLEERLAAEGGEPEEFLRLINAYRVLGREEDARRAYEMSQQKLEGSEASFIREQALVMGLIAE
ncbi:c-type cytochrome biogenesis protein CcmI [Limibaculum sp. FT325]|uniref:c-type cytochrome biogenesis protein CcmI n=1 Tax=Thermohalobaculum sediminis TaxID=2939436 RepID=UPI0020C005A3|nr:c-type cytochrome biogenesis protein CcmI [Limibaculum sediminis]MCL5777331.1 c-type cytochrome biogenesis protein CcmI [Limibaculum sediminis]